MHPAWSPPQERFFLSLAPKVRWGYDKATPNWGLKEEVIRLAAYVTLPVNKYNYLFLDIDEDEAGAFWLEESLPQPTFITVTPESGHAFYGYELATPVTRRLKGGACWVSGKALEYFEAINAAYQKRLCADVGYSGWNGKNPLSDRWALHTHWYDRRYSLDELAKHVNLESRWERQRRPTNFEAPTSSNRRLFDAGSLWSYRKVKCHTNKAAFQIAILEFLEKYNRSVIAPDHGKPEPSANVQGMARSIAAYSWKHRNAAWMAECRKDRKKLGLGRICSNLTFSERQEEIRARQEAGALYANVERKAKTVEKIKGAVLAILARGEKVTISGVAKEAELSRLTVRRHKQAMGEGW